MNSELCKLKLYFKLFLLKKERLRSFLLDIDEKLNYTFFILDKFCIQPCRYTKQQEYTMKNFTILLIACFAIFLSLQIAQALTFNDREYVQIEGEWFDVWNNRNFKVIGTELLVRFTQSATQTEIDSLNDLLDGEVLFKFITEDYHIQSSETTPPDPLDFCEEYLNSSLVLMVVNVAEFEYHQPDDPLFEDQTYLFDEDNEGLNDINWLTAWDLGVVGDPDIRIGIIDDGLLWTHPDILEPNDEQALVTHVWQNIEGEDVGGVDNAVTLWDDDDDEFIHDPGDFAQQVDDDENNAVNDLIGMNAASPWGGPPHEIGYSENVPVWAQTRHGTAVAGIIGALSNSNRGITGIAGGDYENEITGCTIVFVKTVNINPAWAMRGLQYLTDGVENVRIINCSWGGRIEPFMNNLLELAYNAGILLVCSSGNGGDETPDYPASSPFTIAVGASWDDVRSDFSSFGDGLDIVSPVQEMGDDDEDNWASLGMDWVAGPGTEEIPAYTAFGGTSASAPCVSGVAGLVLSQESEIQLEELKEILCTTADRSSNDEEIDYAEDNRFGSWDPQMGYGELNAGNAVIYGYRQEIALDEGWSWISSRMVPCFNADNRLDDENGLFLTCAEIEEDLIQFKDGEGHFWSPEWEFNNIPSWNYLDGYQVNMDQVGTLVVLGRPEDPDEPIPLGLGWNLVAYLPDFNLDEWDGFDNLIDEESLMHAKNQAGQFLIPAYEEGGPFSNMSDLEPNNAYFVKVDGATDLIYPAVEPEAQPPMDNGERKIASETEHFSVTTKTDDFHPVLISSLALDNIEVTAGDEIGLFADGTCIGSSVVTGEFPMGLAIWRDDTLTVERDGYRDDDIFTLYYWSENQDTEYGPDTLSISGNIDYNFTEDLTIADLYFNSVAESIPSSFTLQAAYPNPFNASTTLRFDIPESGALDIAIYSEDGRLVRELNSREVHAGQFRWVWDGRNQSGGPVSSGVYLLRANYHGQSGVMAEESIKLVAVK